jgi:hypothetical protein
MALPSHEDIAQSVATTLRRGDRLMTEAVTIIDTARRHDAQLRLIGGLAVRRYTTDLDFMDRGFSDIDFIGLSSQGARLRRVVEQLGYEENHHVTQATGGAVAVSEARPATRSARPHAQEDRLTTLRATDPAGTVGLGSLAVFARRIERPQSAGTARNSAVQPCPTSSGDNQPCLGSRTVNPSPP